MRRLRALLFRLADRFRRARRDRDLVAELDAHLQLHVDDCVRAGMTPEAARRKALVKLGGVEATKERYRDRRGVPVLDATIQDLRYAVRTLRKARGFTFAALAALTIGIGANSAMFSVVHAVLLRPLPYPAPDRIVTLVNQSPSGSMPIGLSTEFNLWRQQTDILVDISAYRFAGQNVSNGLDQEQVFSLEVTAGFFRLFGVPVVHGRGFGADEDRPDGQRVAVLNHGFWQRHFGGRSRVVGETITLDGISYVVIGVLGPHVGFESLPYLPATPPPDVLVPLAVPDGGAPLRYLVAAARLKPGVALAAAAARAHLVAEEYRRRFPTEIASNETFGVESLPEVVVRGVRQSLLIFMAAVSFVLLIACANVANLLLVRASVRAREIAVRAAIGASRGRIVRQLITESLVLSIAGGVLGLTLGVIGIRVLLTIDPRSIPGIGETVRVVIDWRVLAFTALTSVLTGLLFGLFPALRAGDEHSGRPLMDGSFGSTTGPPHRNQARSLLVISETALALVLLIGAALLGRTFLALRAVDPGFDPHSVLNLPMALNTPRFANTSAVSRVVRDGVQRLKGVPGVTAAGAACCAPMLGHYDYPVIVMGRPLDGPSHAIGGWVNVSPGYFEVFKIPILRGRAFTDRDATGAPGVVIINHTMARRLWPNGDPLRDRLLIGRGFGPAEEPARQIVGIAGDVPDGGLDGEPTPMMFVPMAQVPDALTALHARAPMIWFVRTGVESFLLSDAIQRQLRDASGGVPVARTAVRAMDDVIAESISRQHFHMMLMTIFAAAALLLAAIGVYGVMAYSVQERTREIGIRIALGAKVTEVRNMLLVQGMSVALAGVGIGLIAALVLARVIASFLFGVTARDPAVFTVVPIALAAVALVAVWIPARRATRVDPMVALRHE